MGRAGSDDMGQKVSVALALSNSTPQASKHVTRHEKAKAAARSNRKAKAKAQRTDKAAKQQKGSKTKKAAKAAPRTRKRR